MKSIKTTTIIFFLCSLLISGFMIYHAFDKPKITGKSTETFVGHFSARVDPGIRVLDFTFNGNTTDFLHMNDTALENIINMTIEITTYGKIVWIEPINLTQCTVGNVVDLDSYVHLAYNRTEIIAPNLLCLNHSAILYLYNLPFINPIILRNGILCSSPICTKISYIDWDLEFNVTHFTNYSADEAPASLLPNVSQIFINSSLGTNLSTEDITAYVNMTDDANTSMLVYYNWYADGLLITSGTSTVTNGTLTNISTVASINLVAGEVWTCEVRGWDGEYNGTWTNATITILSPAGPPSAPSTGGGGGTSGKSYAKQEQQPPAPPITEIPPKLPVKPAMKLKPIQQQKLEEAKPGIISEEEESILLYFKQKGNELTYLFAALLIAIIFAAVAFLHRQQDKKKNKRKH